MLKHLCYLLAPLLLLTCSDTVDSSDATNATAPATAPPENPPAEGFDAEGSDPEAIALADSIVMAHGGRQAYDDTRYLSWNFFGFRTLVWDKETKRVRIEVPSQEAIYLLDYSDPDRFTGAVQLAGQEVTHPDSLDKYLDRAHSIWINDSYWLVQPFKLKDSGVTLGYLGRQTDPRTGEMAEAIELRFRKVGDTPDNKYIIFVDPASYRFTTWQFFADAADGEPRMQTPYAGYERYGGIYLSSDRGERKLTDISAPAELENQVFDEF